MLNTIKRQMAFQKSRPMVQPTCDVFINHHGVDTKRSIASLLYHQLVFLGIPSFLGNKNMKPGDKLFEHIDNAILGCKIGVAVFSPRYRESYFCLHELALMMETRKKSETKRFGYALEEAKNTVGLTFDTSKGNWAYVVTYAAELAELVKESLIEVDYKKYPAHHSRILY
ncbi:hypothetical protein OSB04_007990 [Centaurea solstitialis]|uniref:TIR domain-containing protein n=1 Tax=Centaurea solstitialis TaxID=347529 RepID=A0AA38TKW8_9ASTR|nr:hypothetical protein OSB04_007990 [Centaurea solstitialis]